MSWQSYIKTKEDLLRTLSSVKMTEKFRIPVVFEFDNQKINLNELIQKFENRESNKRDLDFLRKVWYNIEVKIDEFIDGIKMGSIDINTAINEMEYYGGLKKAHRKIGEIIWSIERDLRAKIRRREIHNKKREIRFKEKRKRKR